MGKAVALIVVLVVIVGGVAGAWYVFNMLPGHDDEQVTMIMDLTAWDQLAGSQDATTSAVDIYRMVSGNLVKQETVTMDAASKASALTYTSGETLYLKLYDASDVSVCTQYMKMDVPKADPAWVYDGAFQISLPFLDRGNTAKDILVKCHNNTGLTASTVYDVTGSSWDSNFAEIDLEIRALDDDSGYKNTYNFLKGYDNNHYVVISATGTGWDSVNLLTAGWDTYDKASTRYFVHKLSDNDLTRDLQTGGTYNPDGTFIKSLVFDLTGFASGDNVTLGYEYRWYSSWDHFKSTSGWGADTAATSELIYLQY